MMLLQINRISKVLASISNKIVLITFNDKMLGVDLSFILVLVFFASILYNLVILHCALIYLFSTPKDSSSFFDTKF
jgi:hypothetical protein